MRSFGSLEFEKYHTLRNDFLVLVTNPVRPTRRSLGEMARRLCDRQSGIGGDGLLWVRKSDRHGIDAAVDIFNRDGTWAERSGNGLRVAAAYLHRKRSARREEYQFLTGAGVATVSITIRGKHVIGTTSIPAPSFDSTSLPMRSPRREVVGKKLTFIRHQLLVTCLSVGNPHVVVHVKDFPAEWEELGRVIESDRRFPKRTNVEFVRVASRLRLEMKIWERGVGPTGSSGTGAAAALAASVRLGQCHRSVSIHSPAGEMAASWPEDSGEISTTAPVVFIGSGTVVC